MCKAGRRTLPRVSFSNRTATTLSWPCWRATANGVNPSSVARLWLAPEDNKNRTTPSWFSWAAIYRGVNPFCDWTFTAPPCSTKILTTASCKIKNNIFSDNNFQWTIISFVLKKKWWKVDKLFLTQTFWCLEPTFQRKENGISVHFWLLPKLLKQMAKYKSHF